MWFLFHFWICVQKVKKKKSEHFIYLIMLDCIIYFEKKHKSLCTAWSCPNIAQNMVTLKIHVNSIFLFNFWGKKKEGKSERTKEEWDEVAFKYVYIYYFNPHDYKIWNFYQYTNFTNGINSHHSLVLSTLLILPLCIFVLIDLMIE